YLQWLDVEIFRRLLIAFGESETSAAHVAAGPNIGELAANGAGFVLFDAAAMCLARQLTGRGRILATTSLFALCLLYILVAWRLLQVTMHPTGFFVAIKAGFIGGIFLRTHDSARQKEEAHHFELRLKNKELLDTRLTLLKHDEVERRTLAADLHDQVLNDLKQVAQRFDRYVEKPDADNAESIRRLTDQVMSEIREVMDALSPSVLEHLGLSAAIEDCLRRGAQRSGFKIRFKNNVEQSSIDKLSMVEQGLLYRLVQESITNVCKHAQASLVRVALSLENERVLLIRVTDDGRGMDLEKARGDSRGVKYMRYRADLIGANITWKPGDENKGTTVEVRVDLTDRGTATIDSRYNEAGV
ncbi:MAG TPA: ATP-binding protein, partial [Candidatus Obscuribacterales bacterium]